MTTHIYMHRVAKLPTQIQKDSMYFLKGEHDYDMDLFVSGTDPNELLRVVTAKDVLAKILQTYSNFMQIVVVIPVKPAEMFLKYSLYEHAVDKTAENYYLTGRKMGGRHRRFSKTWEAGTVLNEIQLPVTGRLDRFTW